MRGKNEGWQIQSPFSRLKWGDAFHQETAGHYTWSVYSMVPRGLIDLMGGKDGFNQMMDLYLSCLRFLMKVIMEPSMKSVRCRL